MVPIVGIELNVAMKRALHGWSAGPRVDERPLRRFRLLRRGA
jgi:hypothetical protein